MLVLLLAAVGTALATGLGAIPVWFLGERAHALRPLLLGVAAGVMGVASIAGLLLSSEALIADSYPEPVDIPENGGPTDAMRTDHIVSRRDRRPIGGRSV